MPFKDRRFIWRVESGKVPHWFQVYVGLAYRDLTAFAAYLLHHGYVPDSELRNNLLDLCSDDPSKTGLRLYLGKYVLPSELQALMLAAERLTKIDLERLLRVLTAQSGRRVVVRQHPGLSRAARGAVDETRMAGAGLAIAKHLQSVGADQHGKLKRAKFEAGQTFGISPRSVEAEWSKWKDTLTRRQIALDKLRADRDPQ
ncbi:hypothetical protein [Sphingomonas sp.]|uniref:hypothetical protein n=1 Tax=Sphingomonas sp. TaxID=28214 RepID=UPI0025D3E372|nr:hypothetical protein [Sphingomonas sp.]